jgi:hypothetical protein
MAENWFWIALLLGVLLATWWSYRKMSWDLDVASDKVVALGNLAAQTERSRRRDAKQWNERLKLMATFLNGIGIALFIGLVVTLPGRTAGPTGSDFIVGLVSAVGLHILAQWILSGWKSEE